MTKRPRTPAARPTARPKAPGQSAAPTHSFADTLRILPSAPQVGAPAPPEHESLVQLDYAVELAFKLQGLRSFWSQHRLPGQPEDIVASPRPRGYRTSSKRRVAVRNKAVSLFLGDHTPRETHAFVASPLEPLEHAAVYQMLQAKLREPIYRLLATHLSYLIIRGNYAERALILNVDNLNGPIVRKIKMLGDLLRPQLRALFVYLDPSRSNYHFESRRPDESVTFKRIFGPDHLAVRFAERRYHYHPTSFSQVNESIVPEILARSRDLLAPDGSESLLDLYCGYGLFSHYLAPDYSDVVGVDLEGPSIRAATANSRLNPCKAPRRFLAAPITADLVRESLRRQGEHEVILLDPPRNGPLPGVVAALGRRAPRKVLHVFCDVDQIPQSLAQWRGAGYHPRRIVPLDMFPGSTNLEVLILLSAEEAIAAPRQRR